MSRAVELLLGEILDAIRLLQQYPDTPWSDIAGARDIMIHEYFRVDIELAWEMVREDIGPLAATVRRILQGHFPEDADTR